MPASRIYTIPSSAPFLPTLIGALVRGDLVSGFSYGGDPLALARATLYLPTRRACRLARDVFLDVLEGDAAILPRIAAIGDVDEDEIVFAELGSGALAADALALPPPLAGQQRKLLLAQLILAWSRSPEVRTEQGAPLVANNPATAFALASDLARLMDDMITRDVSWDRLDQLVPSEMDAYWALTLRFLQFVRGTWPHILKERGAIEPTERRDRLIAAETARLKRAVEGPVIAAGSTGSIPSTAALLAAIARLPNGAVVLPGLDTDLDPASWDLIADIEGADGRSKAAPAYGHPQFAMHALLRRLGVKRDAVASLGKPAPHGREILLSEALRPAAATHEWGMKLAGEFSRHVDAGLSNLAMIEAANSEDESLAVAVALREAVETPKATAALITPDRALARRVLAALERWKVAVDDSGGDSLCDVPAGVFARLVADVALGDVEPAPLLALLKHPLCRLGAHEFAHAPAIAALERAVLRGPRPRAGTSGLSHALEALRQNRSGFHRNDPRSALTDRDIDLAAALIGKLAAALAPLESIEGKVLPLAEISARHRAAVENLSRDQKGALTAFANSEGNALSAIFDDTASGMSAGALAVPPAEYPELFRSMCTDRVVRRAGAPGARVRIYGPLEARLQQVDRVVLGGLSEGVWPPDARSDPWLSRPMRQDLGLDLPERRIGLSAHDFAQALGTKEVVLSRSAKLAGAPVVASRFVQRLAAIAGKKRWQAVLDRGNLYLEWARSLDRPAEVRPAKRPAPKPPVAARPTRLTVTEIEHWLRDPYTIYAKHVLRLIPLDPVDTPPGARDRGSVIHEALGAFNESYPAQLPEQPLERLIEIGRERFLPLNDYPEARAFWWPRFRRIAQYYIGWESARRSNISALKSEIRGEIEVTKGERAFRLAATADRIERLTDNRYAVIDFKTGKPPTASQVAAGLSPQLTLEAAILRNGGYKDFPAGGSVAELSYLRLSGANPPGKPEAMDFKKSTPDQEADKALKRLREVVQKFESEDEGYRSFFRPMWSQRVYGDYDHLARVKEWSAAGGELEEGEGGEE